jgi:hypothetical protein
MFKAVLKLIEVNLTMVGISTALVLWGFYTYNNLIRAF